MSADALARSRAVREPERSFVLEASAGTGKTRTLVDRIVHLVLERGPAGPPLRLGRIAAITFTEKAAGEMKLRLRQTFEQAAARDGDAAARARQALLDLESAPISTIHAFAVGLLKARPVEAALDPRFRPLPPVEADLLFRETWLAWRDAALRARRGPLEAALRGGLRLSDVDALARALRSAGHLARDLPLERPPRPETLSARRADYLEYGRGLRRRLLAPGDKLGDRLAAALEWLEGGGEAPLAAGSTGRAAAWRGGEATLREVRDAIASIVGLHDAIERLPAEQLLYDVAGWLVAELLPAWEERKRLEGVLEFDDQLVAARDLLRRSRAARRDFQADYATLLVDEFQDTDPVQLEIALLLGSSDLDETDPARLVPDPGRLFLVGDPKQSIYRFRGADIETYLRMMARERLAARGLERLQLTRNFRSVPPILAFVDAVFARLLGEGSGGGSVQPAYLPFGVEGARPGDGSARVALLTNQTYEGDADASGDEAARREAARLARLVGVMVAEPAWRIEDPERGCERAAAFGDIAILLPVLSKANLLEEALDERGIPHVLEGGKFYYTRSEVGAAITVLRAAANPNDAVATYGALRSIFFGLSDEDLLRARIAGAPLDYRTPVPPGSPLGPAFGLLARLSRLERERPASELLELLLLETGAREVLSARPGGVQSLANLAKLGRTLRACQRGHTFSETLELVAMMDDEGWEEAESRIVEERSDAVRILTVHRAKGLDFPIVIAAGLGLGGNARSGTVIADRHERRILGLAAGRGSSGFRSPSWEDLRDLDRERDQAEKRRLLYVALTRARDHLVVSLHTSRRAASREQAGLLETLRGLFDELTVGSHPLARRLDGRELDAASGAAVAAAAAAVSPDSAVAAELGAEDGALEALRRLPPGPGRRPPAAQAEEAAGEAAAVEADGARDRARRLGIAFHEAMERADLAAGPPVRERVDEAAARQKLDRAAAGELEAMLAATFGSTLFERIRTALVGGAAVHRELPFVRLAGESGALEEGKIDLLIREAAGWVIVDYKTDRTPAGVADVAGHFRERYGAQIAAYGAALAEAGIPVRAGYLLLARSGAVVEVPLDRDGWRRGASGTLRPSAEPARAERAELDSRRQERTIQRPLPFDDRE